MSSLIIRLAVVGMIMLSGCGKQAAPVSREIGDKVTPGEALTVDVLFSPRGGCTARIVAEIGKAKTSLFCQAYSFTSQAICDAVVAAHRRGVKVMVVLDRSQENGNGTKIMNLHNAGVPTWVDRKHAISHNKIIIIDAEVVITGSFNFTQSAETSNAENVVIIKSVKLAKAYYDNWAVHHAHSEKFNPDARPNHLGRRRTPSVPAR